MWLHSKNMAVNELQSTLSDVSKLATCNHELESNSYSCLVVCPLESIIQDQITEAASCGITSMKSDDDFKNNSSKHAQLLFATVEYVEQPWFRRLLKDNSSVLSKISLVVVAECHTTSASVLCCDLLYFVLFFSSKERFIGKYCNFWA